MNLDWLRGRGTHQLLHSLPWRSRLILFTAIFFTFGSVGFIDDVFSVRDLKPWPLVLVHVIYVGLVAVGYIWAISTTRWLIPVAMAFHIAVPKWILPALRQWVGGATPAQSFSDVLVQHRLEWDGIGCIICIALGYAVFIRFIAWEGRKHLRLRTEIGVAQRMHAALVPPVAVETSRFEVFGRSEPSTEVGGDLLDVVELDNGLVICVADVSGHGVTAGSIMGMVKSAVRMRLLTSDSLAGLLNDLDGVVRQICDPGMFVTFAGARFDGSNEAELALAGHLPILHWRRATGSVVAIESATPPLGVVAGQRHAPAHATLERGDLFVFLTDGLTEVTDRGGEELGLAGVEAALRNCAERPLAEIYSLLLASARAHGPQIDDQTLALVRVL